MGSGPGRSEAVPPAEARKGQAGILPRLMATKTKNKSAVRTGKGKGGRRPVVKSGPDLMLLPIAVGAILLALAIGLIVYVIANNKTPAGPVVAASIPCDQLEHTQVHYHAAIQIMSDGVVHPIPANIGIVTDPTSGAVKCYYWLHVHAANPNTIHIESPANQTFTLGQFFAVWTAWNQALGLPAEPLDSKHVSSFTLTADQKLVVYVDKGDGKGPQIYDGDPKKIVLAAHAVITLEITPPAATTPPPFTFASAL